MNAHAAGAVHLDWPDGPSFADLSPDETARLGNILRPLPWIDGLMTAAIVAPDEPEDWLEHIWIEEQLGKLTPSQAEAVTSTVTDQYVHIVNTLFQSPEAYRPYLSDAADQVAAATQWAAGFCFGMRLHPEPWAPLINDDDARALMVFIFCLERDEDLPEASRADSPFKDISPDRRQEMRREVAAILPEVVCALHASRSASMPKHMLRLAINPVCEPRQRSAAMSPAHAAAARSTRSAVWVSWFRQTPARPPVCKGRGEHLSHHAKAKLS